MRTIWSWELWIDWLTEWIILNALNFRMYRICIIQNASHTMIRAKIKRSNQEIESNEWICKFVRSIELGLQCEFRVHYLWVNMAFYVGKNVHVWQAYSMRCSRIKLTTICWKQCHIHNIDLFKGKCIVPWNGFLILMIWLLSIIHKPSTIYNNKKSHSNVLNVWFFVSGLIKSFAEIYKKNMIKNRSAEHHWLNGLHNEKSDAQLKCMVQITFLGSI